MSSAPLYIPSKGRHEFMVTSKALTAMGVRHFIIAEPAEVDLYRASVARMGLAADVLELDLAFKDRYETCDDLGATRSYGPGPARNFAWEHSKAAGADWHWVMDDNIIRFARLNRNLMVTANTPAFFQVMEEFAQRYQNVAMAGPNYEMFCPTKYKAPPFITNTRIYSCNLIRNSVRFRWRGRYNEDTILSLDMLKGGWCTIQFNAFVQKKMNTQALPGGNTAEFYHAEGQLKEGLKYADKGTLAKSQMLVRVHPDVARLVWKFQRVHHHVDYGRYKHQALIRRPDLVIDPQPNEFGMQLRQRQPAEARA